MRAFQRALRECVLVGVAALLALVIVPGTALAQGGTVSVTGSGQTYASLSDAAKAVKANGTTGVVTYTVSGSVDFDGAPTATLAPQGVTGVSIVGNAGAQVTLTGTYAGSLYTTPNGRADGKLGVPLRMSNLTLNDGRNEHEGEMASGNPGPWEFTYLSSNASTEEFDGVTFTEGFIVGQIHATSVQKGTFRNCTFKVSDPMSALDDDMANKKSHYELWLSGMADVTVDGCTFTPNAYGAIKGTYSNTYASYYPKPYVALSVYNSTFNGIGHHHVVHLDGADALSFRNNTLTNCYNSDKHDRQFVDVALDKTGGKAAVISADYFGANANDNRIQYSLFLTKDGKAVAGAPAYYQYNQTLATYELDGYTYQLAKGSTVADTKAMLPAGSLAGMYESTKAAGWSVFTTGSLAGDDATSIPLSSVGPRRYELAKGTANTYTIKFEKNADDATGTMDPMTAVYGKDVTLPACAFSRTGYVFVGWNTSADGKGLAVKNAATMRNLSAKTGATITLYAQWGPDKHPKPGPKGCNAGSTTKAGEKSACPSRKANASKASGANVPLTSDDSVSWAVLLAIVVCGVAAAGFGVAELRRRSQG